MSAVILHNSRWYWLDSEAPERANLTGPEGEDNRKELQRVAKHVYGFTMARQLADCPIACQLFPPTPTPSTTHIQIEDLSNSPTPLRAPRRHMDHCPREDPPIKSRLKSPDKEPNKGRDTDTHRQLHPPPALPVQNGAKPQENTCQINRRAPLKPPQPTGPSITTIPNKDLMKSGKITKQKVETEYGPKKKKLKQTSITNFTLQPNRHSPPHTTHTHKSLQKENTTPNSNTSHTHGCEHESTNAAQSSPLCAQPLICITANTPSLYAHKHDVENLLRKYKPDTITCVDIRLLDKHRNAPWLHELLRGYKFWVSTSQDDGLGARGVLIAVKEHLAVLGKAVRTTGDTCKGRILNVTLTLPHSLPLSITGVYGPAGNTLADNTERDQVYTRITKIQDDATVTYGKETKSLMMGDWNAALLPGDRSSNIFYQKDLEHQHFITNTKLKPLDKSKAPNRSHTYSHLTESSRIDDILTDFHTSSTTLTIDEGALSDHLPLMGRIDMQGTGVFIPSERKNPASPPVQVLVRPISNEDKAAFLDKVHSYSQGQGLSINNLLSKPFLCRPRATKWKDQHETHNNCRPQSHRNSGGPCSRVNGYPPG